MVPLADFVMDVQLAAAKLAEARVEEAEAFLRYRITSGKTDNQARAQAIVETGSELDRAQARYDVALARLQYEARNASQS